jgi:hypothetical protein
MRQAIRCAAAAVAVATAGAPGASAQQRTTLSPQLQVRLAVQAAPAALRDSATVQGWNSAGALVTLRHGTNALICVAPDPRNAQLEVSCHHRDLEPFLARGRELAARGITGERRVRARWDEIAAGALPLPSGTVNAIMTGTSFDSATGAIRDPYLRWVIYVPGATTASTGISDVPAGPGAPWLMFAGTPGAHIMISPPRPDRSGAGP